LRCKAPSWKKIAWDAINDYIKYKWKHAGSLSPPSRARKANRNYPIPFVAKGTVGVTMVRQIKAIRLEQTRRIFRALRISDLNSFVVRPVVEKNF